MYYQLFLPLWSIVSKWRLILNKIDIFIVIRNKSRSIIFKWNRINSKSCSFFLKWIESSDEKFSIRLFSHFLFIPVSTKIFTVKDFLCDLIVKIRYWKINYFHMNKTFLSIWKVNVIKEKEILFNNLFINQMSQSKLKKQTISFSIIIPN